MQRPRCASALRSFALALAGLACAAGWSEAPPVLLLEPGISDYALTPFIQLLRDERGEYTIDEVSSEAFAERFEGVGSPSLNLGVTHDVFWLRFSVEDLRSQRTLLNSWLLDLSWVNLQNVTLYTPETQEDGSMRYTTRERSIDERKPESVLQNMRSILPLGSPREQVTTYYVRVQHDSAVLLPAHLRTVESYLRLTWFRTGLNGFYVGTLFSIALYNFLMFLVLRQRVYLFYVAYLGFGIVYYVSKLNLLQETIFIGMPGLDARVRVAALSLAAMACFGFARDFLLTAERNKPLDRVLMCGAGVWGLFACLVPLLPVGFMDIATSILGIVTPVVVLMAGGISYIQGFAPARYYVVAWAFLTFGYVLWSLMHLGLVTPEEYIPWTVQGLTALEAILLSFALADRIRVMRQETEEAGQRERRYRELAITDELTGLYNVRLFRTQLPLEVQRADMLHLPLTLGMLDIDNFKQYNDTHGHPAGDVALRQLGEVISQCVRERDIACRYGGEEFVIVFPATRAAEAHEAAERIRAGYERIRRNSGGASYGASVSIGLAEHLPGEKPEALVERADRALYAAKSEGKNRIALALAK